MNFLRTVGKGYALHMQDISNDTKVKRVRKEITDGECLYCMEKSNVELQCGHHVCENCISKSKIIRCPYCYQGITKYYIDR